MSKVISVVSTKGGVGKTTLSANLGAFLTDQGFKTLIIDADVQPSLTQCYPIQKQAEHGLRYLFTNSSVQPDDVVSEIEPNLSIVISDDQRDELRKWAQEAPDGRLRLRQLLQQRFNHFDYIIIDTQGAVGPLQEASIIASDIILSPVVPDKLSASEFIHNTISMLNRLHESASWMGLEIGTLYGVLNMVEHTSDSSAYADEIRSVDFSSRCAVPIKLLDVMISRSVVWKDASSMRTPAHRLETSTRRKSGSALEIMTRLSKEIGLLEE